MLSGANAKYYEAHPEFLIQEFNKYTGTIAVGKAFPKIQSSVAKGDEKEIGEALLQLNDPDAEHWVWLNPKTKEVRYNPRHENEVREFSEKARLIVAQRYGLQSDKLVIDWEVSAGTNKEGGRDVKPVPIVRDTKSGEIYKLVAKEGGTGYAIEKVNPGTQMKQTGLSITDKEKQEKQVVESFSGKSNRNLLQTILDTGAVDFTATGELKGMKGKIELISRKLAALSSMETLDAEETQVLSAFVKQVRRQKGDERWETMLINKGKR